MHFFEYSCDFTADIYYSLKVVDNINKFLLADWAI